MKSSLHIVTRYKLGGADCWILTILLVDGYIPGCENAFFFQLVILKSTIPSSNKHMWPWISGYMKII